MCGSWMKRKLWDDAKVVKSQLRGTKDDHPIQLANADYVTWEIIFGSSISDLGPAVIEEPGVNSALSWLELLESPLVMQLLYRESKKKY